MMRYKKVSFILALSMNNSVESFGITSQLSTEILIFNTYSSKVNSSVAGPYTPFKISQSIDLKGKKRLVHRTSLSLSTTTMN